MIDHKICRLGGNPAANLIIPTMFYVAELQKVRDDKAFLKTSQGGSTADIVQMRGHHTIP
jgi:hypothetical protein